MIFKPYAALLLTLFSDFVPILFFRNPAKPTKSAGGSFEGDFVSLSRQEGSHVYAGRQTLHKTTRS